MFGLGMPEIVLIAAVVFLLFGGTIMKRFFSNAAVAIKESRAAVKEVVDAANAPVSQS